nr:unnamed protein product [Callosobruchus chinensis]
MHCFLSGLLLVTSHSSTII